jgi:hypothetical protein
MAEQSRARQQAVAAQRSIASASGHQNTVAQVCCSCAADKTLHIWERRPAVPYRGGYTLRISIAAR